MTEEALNAVLSQMFTDFEGIKDYQKLALGDCVRISYRFFNVVANTNITAEYLQVVYLFEDETDTVTFTSLTDFYTSAFADCAAVIRVKQR